MSETKTGIAALMNSNLNAIPERRKAEPGRYEGTLKVAKYEPDNKNKVFLAFGDLKDLDDSGRDLRGYENVMTSWTEDTPEAFLEDLGAFFRSHKNFRGDTNLAEMLPELPGKRYTFRIERDRKKPEYTNVRAIRAIE